MSEPISYVINLKRRGDRLDAFNKKYLENGPNIPLVVVEAIDGSEENVLDTPDMSYISKDNDFNNCPKIIACALSHIKTWSKIVESGCPGFIFEDDVNFREDKLFKTKFDKLVKDIADLDKKFTGHKILYIGAGDILPIHTNIGAESLMRAQEKTHIKEFVNESIGVPSFRSAYIFSWLGAFSYYLDPKTAQYLLSSLGTTKPQVLDSLKSPIPGNPSDLSNPMKTAVDVYLKNKFVDNIFIVSPLLTYHDTLETSNSDICKRNRK